MLRSSNRKMQNKALPAGEQQEFAATEQDNTTAPVAGAISPNILDSGMSSQSFISFIPFLTVFGGALNFEPRAPGGDQTVEPVGRSRWNDAA